MPNVYVAPVEELRARLVAAQGAGKKLERVKRVWVGIRALNSGMVDFPVIMISPFPATEGYGSAQRKKNAEMTITLRVADTVPSNAESAANILYETSSKTGILYLVPIVLDVINETTAQVVDPRLNEDARQSVDVEVDEPQYGQNHAWCDVRVRLTTRDFSPNGRDT